MLERLSPGSKSGRSASENARECPEMPDFGGIFSGISGVGIGEDEDRSAGIEPPELESGELKEEGRGMGKVCPSTNGSNR